MPIGGSNLYPSLESIASLFRAQINDSFAGATDTPGEGVVMPDTNPDLLVFMNSAIRDVYSDLRNVGDPELILDNYVLLNLPPVNAAMNPPNPAVQVSLSYYGYFDGQIYWPQWTLPAGCIQIEKVSERWSNTNGPFNPMTPAAGGLAQTRQTQWLGSWETRQGALWMPGSLVYEDLSIRCRITFPDNLGPSINFSTTYVPILNCQNSVVAKMLVLYSKRFSPEQYPMAVAEDERMLFKLRLEVVRELQNTEYQRLEWGQEAQASYGWLAQL